MLSFIQSYNEKEYFTQYSSSEEVNEVEALSIIH